MSFITAGDEHNTVYSVFKWNILRTLKWHDYSVKNLSMSGRYHIVLSLLSLLGSIHHFHTECFHSRGQHICKFIGTKESVWIRKEFNSQRTGLGHQHGRRFIVSGHQSGLRDVMWKHSIDHYPPCLPPKFCITIVFDFSWDDWEPAKFLRVNKFLYGLCENGELIFPAPYPT